MKERSGMMKQIDSTCAAAQWYRTFTKKWSKPAAIIAVSAHWEERGAVRVTTGVKHPLFFDYYGFPDYTYDLECVVVGFWFFWGGVFFFLSDGFVFSSFVLETEFLFGSSVIFYSFLCGYTAVHEVLLCVCPLCCTSCSAVKLRLGPYNMCVLCTCFRM